jgi:hypothetical protein
MEIPHAPNMEARQRLMPTQSSCTPAIISYTTCLRQWLDQCLRQWLDQCLQPVQLPALMNLQLVKRAQPAKISKINNGKVAKAMLNELNKASHFALSHQSGGGSTFKRSEPYLATIFGMSANASLRKCGRLHIPWPLPRSRWRRALLGGRGLGGSMLGKAHCEWSPSSASVGRAHSNSSCTANG